MFEQFFCEAFLEPGDGVLVFSPQFPTYEPNIDRRGGAAGLRPAPARRTRSGPTSHDVETFVEDEPQAEGDLPQLAAQPDRRRRHARTTWRRSPTWSAARTSRSSATSRTATWSGTGRHQSLLAEPGMLDQCVAAYTFSKSYSMSGWRLGYAVSTPDVVESIGKMINTSLSCVPPLVQLAGEAALENDAAERDEVMAKFQQEGRAAGRRAEDGRRA